MPNAVGSVAFATRTVRFPVSRTTFRLSIVRRCSCRDLRRSTEELFRVFVLQSPIDHFRYVLGFIHSVASSKSFHLFVFSRKPSRLSERIVDDSERMHQTVHERRTFGRQRKTGSIRRKTDLSNCSRADLDV